MALYRPPQVTVRGHEAKAVTVVFADRTFAHLRKLQVRPFALPGFSQRLALMTSTATRIDWAAVKERLASVTDDPAVLAGLDRMRKTGDFDDAFMREIVEGNVSLDWLFLGEGRPGRSGEVS